MNCQLGSPVDPKSPSALTPVEYWYAIETAASYSSKVAFEVELKIQGVAKESMRWCYKNDGNRRLEAYYLDEDDRRLGIMALNSAPLDMRYSDDDLSSCPQKLKNENDNCYVMKGGLTLEAHSTNDLSATVGSIHTGIKQAMANDTLLDSNDPIIGDITRIVYLGDTIDEAHEYGMTPKMPSPKEEGESGTNGSVSDVTTTTMGRNDEVFVPVLAASLVGTGVLALLLLFLRRRRKVMTRRQLDYGAAIAAASSETSTSSMDDPPGSFHQGYYHYTKDRVRYLSPFCSTCRETERQLALGHGLETISEDSEFVEGSHRLVAANSKDLGGHHSTMNVHNCSSAMCQLCREREATDVTFVPWVTAQESTITASDETMVVSNTKRSKRTRTMEV